MSFISFNPEEDIIIDNSAVVGALWSGGALTLASGSFFTSSEQASSNTGLSYLNVYQSAVEESIAEVQFAIAYGHISGSGSAPFNAAMPEIYTQPQHLRAIPYFDIR
jgi:hypothetical protein